MKKKILSYLIIWLLWFLSAFAWNNFVNAQEGVEECHWIKLNTKVPFIWDCIESKNATTVFPTMTQWLVKIGMSVILVVCFILIIVGWIMIASNNKIWKWKDLIIKVARVVALLWLSWVILKLINPTFFW